VAGGMGVALALRWLLSCAEGLMLVGRGAARNEQQTKPVWFGH
jgi:hypothetical protein